MRTLCIVFFLAWTASAALPEDVLDRLKKATVFILAEEATGSGFLVHQGESDHGNFGLVATNFHVIEEAAGDKLQVVFDSGRASERKVKAELVSALPDDDLALLRVQLDDLPDPIRAPAQDPAVRETQEVFAAGFPFGSLIGTREEGNPEITVTPASVSALRKGNDEFLDVIQIDGDVNPGNSGGPLILPDGSLVGVVVATLMGTQVSWAIPARHVQRLMQSGVQDVSVSLAGRDGVKVTAKAILNTPIEPITEVELLYAKAPEKLPLPQGDGSYREIGDVLQRHNMTIRGKEGTVEFDPDWDRAAGSRPFVLQVRVVTKSGEAFSAPFRFDLIERGETEVELRRNEVEGGRPEVLDLNTGMKVVTMRAAGTDFALNPANGDMAALEWEKDSVVLHSRKFLETGEGKVKASVQVGSQPVGIVYKKYKDKAYFAVACYADARVHILNADDLTPVAQIATGQSQIAQVGAAQAPDDHWLYFSFGAGHDCAMGAIDLRSMTFTGPAIDDAMDFAISADGRYFYRRGPWSPSGFDCLIRTMAHEDKPVFTSIVDEHRSTPAYLTDTLGEYTACAQFVYSANLKQKVADLDFSAQLFHPRLPAILGLRNDELVIASRNSFRTVSYIVLPQVLREPLNNRGRISTGRRSADFKRLSQRVRLLPDPERECVVMATADAVLVIPDDALGMGHEPLLRTKIDGPSALRPGETSSWPVTALDERVNLELEQAPDGVDFDGKQLTWTPDVSQIGEHVINLGISFGDHSKVQSLRVHVAAQSISFDFVVQGLALSPSGKQGIAWGPQDGVHTLALLDVASGKVLKTKTVSTPFSSVAVDEERVYLGLKDSAVMSVLTLNDFKEEKRLFLQAASTHIVATGQAVISMGKESFDCWRMPGYKRLSLPGKVATPQGRNSVLIEGALYRGDLSKPESLGLRRGLLVVDPLTGSAMHASVSSRTPQIVPGPYGRHTQRDGLYSGNRKIFGSSQPLALVEDLPVAIELLTPNTRRHYRQPAVQPCTYNIRSIVDGRIINTAMLDDQFSGSPTPAIVGGGRFFVRSGKRLPYATLSKDLADLPAPMYFQRTQSSFVIAPEGKTTLSHILKNAPKDVSYNLHGQSGHLQIDSKTGAITVDGEKIYAHVAEKIKGQVGTQPNESMQAFAARHHYHNEAHATFRQLTGKEAKGLPVGVSMKVTARTEAGMQADLQYTVLLDLPAENFARKIPAPTPSVSATRHRLLGATTKTATPTTSSDAATEARIKALEERIIRLEAKIELLTKLLLKE